MRQPYKLSPSEIDILVAGAEDPDLITDYFFRPYGSQKGWVFDDNFAPEGAWQKTVHLASQTDITVIGGFGTGKTSGVAMSACVWAMTSPWFKFLNVAPKQWQARQMYDYILLVSAGTPFEKLIWEKPRRPYPKIVLKFKIDDIVFESSLEFMSADRDATGILSWEGDWINVEEAGLLDNLEEIVTAVGSRLRGSVRGRSRLGRLSMISNSWDNAYLWAYFDMAVSDPDHYLSIVVSTRHNKNVTEDQLKKMISRIPENEREQFIDGSRPEGRGKYFSKEAVYGCESDVYAEYIEKNVREGVPGYSLESIYGAGVVYFATPLKEEGVYIVVGDPGTGNAPGRNSPPISAWFVPLDFPKRPAQMAALWWGSGNGAITPFIEKLLEFREMYNPVIVAVDSTGTQKNLAEMINVQYLMLDTNAESPMVGISGLDFSGPKKSGYLVVARLFIENHLLVWPQSVIGLRSQLTNYDPERDKKIAQDLVAMLSMAAYIIRSYFNVDLSEINDAQNQRKVDEEIQYRLPRDQRERRSPSRKSTGVQVRQQIKAD